MSELGKREADLAIRNFRPTGGDLVTRKIREDSGYLYATPAYLDAIGNPTSARSAGSGRRRVHCV